MSCFTSSHWVQEPVPDAKSIHALDASTSGVAVGGEHADGGVAVWSRTPSGWTQVWSGPDAWGVVGLAHTGEELSFIVGTRRVDRRTGSTYAFYRRTKGGWVGPWPVPMSSVATMVRCAVGPYWAHGANGLMRSEDGLSWDDLPLPGTRNPFVERVQCLDSGGVAVLGPQSFASKDGETWTPIESDLPIAVRTGLYDIGWVDRNSMLRQPGSTEWTPMIDDQAGRPQAAFANDSNVWVFRDRVGRQTNTSDFFVSSDGGRSWTHDQKIASSSTKRVQWVGPGGEAWIAQRGSRGGVVWHRRPDRTSDE